jgi:hypothetical protein
VLKSIRKFPRFEEILLWGFHPLGYLSYHLYRRLVLRAVVQRLSGSSSSRPYRLRARRKKLCQRSPKSVRKRPTSLLGRQALRAQVCGLGACNELSDTSWCCVNRLGCALAVAEADIASTCSSPSLAWHIFPSRFLLPSHRTLTPRGAGEASQRRGISVLHPPARYRTLSSNHTPFALLVRLLHKVLSARSTALSLSFLSLSARYLPAFSSLYTRFLLVICPALLAAIRPLPSFSMLSALVLLLSAHYSQP